MTHSEISEYLFSYGIKGHRYSPGRCPVAVWLSSEIDWVHTLVVSRDRAAAYPKGGVVEGPNTVTSVSMESMGNIRLFIENFDRGFYIHLIDNVTP